MKKQSINVKSDKLGLCIVLGLMMITDITVFGSDVPKPIGCSIQAQPSDISSVNKWQVVTFQLVQCTRTATSWSVQGGHTYWYEGDIITVFFNGNQQPVITASDDLGEITHRSNLTFNSNVDELYPGAISGGKTQFINYDSTNAIVQCSTPLHTSGTVSYKWYSSTNGTSFAETNIKSASFPAVNLTQTTYFKRAVYTPDADDPANQGFYQVSYTDVATVTVYPQLISGTASSSQAVNYNTSPAQLSVTAATGGKPGDHTYTWQSSTSATGPFFSTGFTGMTYNPPQLTSSTYYRVQTNSNGVLVYSNVILITVYPDIQGGIVTPTTKAINYNTSPGTLTASGISGGTGSGYTYKWQTSTNNTNWTDVPGQTTLTYAVGLLTAPNNWFRVVTTNNGASKPGSPSKITVYQPLTVGAISIAGGGSNTILANTEMPGLINDNIQGGNPDKYVYQWQKSLNGQSWTTKYYISYYPSEILTANTYYRLAVTSNGVTVYSPTIVIYVGANIGLDPGVITTAVRVLDIGMTADTIKATSPSGGTHAYSYIWEKSTDGIHFDATTITTDYYPPRVVGSVTYLRRSVTDGTHTASTNPIRLVVETLPIDNNYVRTRVITKEGVFGKAAADALIDPTEVTQTTQHYDGLGRPLQTVVKKGSPDRKDMITVQVYDQYNTESYHYMPYASATSGGVFQQHPLLGLTDFNQGQFTSDTVFFGKTIYETSPLRRPISTNAPGNTWAKHAVLTSYSFNTTADSVLIWNVDTNGTVVDSLIYSAGQLIKTTTTDESSRKVVEFKDMDGHVILKKVEAVDPPGDAHNGWACTYYVYDDNNNLVAVIPPEGVKRFIQSSQAQQ